jgi:hypothetical protein
LSATERDVRGDPLEQARADARHSVEVFERRQPARAFCDDALCELRSHAGQSVEVGCGGGGEIDAFVRPERCAAAGVGTTRP